MLSVRKRVGQDTKYFARELCLARGETRLPLLPVLPGFILVVGVLLRTQVIGLARPVSQDARIKAAQMILLNEESQFGTIEC